MNKQTVSHIGQPGNDRRDTIVAYDRATSRREAAADA